MLIRGQYFAMTIGVLAIQGDYEAHGRVLEGLGAKVIYIRKPQQLELSGDPLMAPMLVLAGET